MDCSHPQMQTFMNTKTVLLEIKKHTPSRLLCLTKSGWLKQFPSHPRHNPPAFFFKKLRSDGYGCSSDMFGTFVNARLLTNRRASKNEKKQHVLFGTSFGMNFPAQSDNPPGSWAPSGQRSHGKATSCVSLDPKPLSSIPTPNRN